MHKSTTFYRHHSIIDANEEKILFLLNYAIWNKIGDNFAMNLTTNFM